MTHDRDKIFAAAKEADSGFTGDESFNLGTSLVGLEAIELFYAIAFEAGRQAELEECAVEAEKQGEDEPYGHAKFRCHNIAAAIRARGDTK